MAVNLSPIYGAGAQLFNDDGNVLSGGFIYTYQAGTSTPVATYTSAAGNIANQNPIQLDAAGRTPQEIWLTDSQSYKFVVKDSSGVLIGTYDNLVGINSNFVSFTSEEETQTATQGQTLFTLTTMQYQPGTNNLLVFVNGSKQIVTDNYTETSGTEITFIDGLNAGDVVDFTTATPVSANITDASLVTYNPPFTGGVSTNVELKLAQAVSVMDFGATGDGTTDDTLAVQAAINECNNIYFPSGTYKITSEITLKSNLTLQFDANSSIQIPNGLDFIVFNGLSLSNLIFRDMTIIGNGQVAGFDSIKLDTCSNVLFDNCVIHKSRGTAIQLISCSFVKIQNCDLSYNYYYGCEDRDGIGNKFIDNNFYSNGDTGITTSTGGRGLVLWRSHDTYVAGNTFKSNTEYGFRIYSVLGETSAEGIADARIIGNFFSDNNVIDLYCYNNSTYVTSIVIADNIVERTTVPSQSCVTLSGSNVTVTNTHIRSETLLDSTIGFSLFGCTNITISDSSTKNIGQAISFDGSSNPQSCVINNFFGNGMVKIGQILGGDHRIINSKFVHAGAGTTDNCFDFSSTSTRCWLISNIIDGFNYGIIINNSPVSFKENTTLNSTTNGLRAYGSSISNNEFFGNSWLDNVYPGELNSLNKLNSSLNRASGFYNSIPTNLTWAVGDQIFNSSPAVGQPKGWICTVAGTPGTWVSMGNL